MHVTVAGWLLGPPSGANRRLLGLLGELGPLLGRGERVTVLHRWDYEPPSLPGIGWKALSIPAGPTFARVRGERHRLPSALRELGATVHDHGFLPLPRLHVPTCLVVHDLRGPDGLARFPRWIARSVLRSACARAAVVVAPSEWTAARLRS
ncbi:MAG: glycosyltransferase, partial [Planctomycetota bacterium]